jgi:hypothetical protein
MEMFRRWAAPHAAMAICLSAFVSAHGQQPVAPATGDLPCSEEAQISPTDTVVSAPDAQGYFSLFDGSFKGWFQSCQTLHSQADRSVGAIWRVGPGTDGKPVIFSAQRYPKKVGGVLMTKKKYGNYEIVFDIWPTYQDDGGIFNRTDMQGNCYQTLLDYINGSGLGGPYGEGNFTQFLHPPWKFNSDTDPKQMSLGSDERSWTNITKKLKANGSEPNLPCPANGCTKDDWLRLWDFGGWNQIKVQFYGGTGPGTGAVHMRSWMKKPADTVWVPLSVDSTAMGTQTIKPGYVGLQVHWNTGWQDKHWNLYRDIKWRPLDDKGKPTSIPTAARQPVSSPAIFSFTASATSLMGTLDQDYAITVRDPGGRVLEEFTGKAGNVRHDFATGAHGILFLEIRTVSGAHTASVVRAFR